MHSMKWRSVLPPSIGGSKEGGIRPCLHHDFREGPGPPSPGCKRNCYRSVDHGDQPVFFVRFACDYIKNIM